MQSTFKAHSKLSDSQKLMLRRSSQMDLHFESTYGTPLWLPHKAETGWPFKWLPIRKTTTTLDFYDTVLVYDVKDEFCCYPMSMEKRAIPRFLILSVEFDKGRPWRLLRMAAIVLTFGLGLAGVAGIIAKANGEPYAKRFYGCKELPCTDEELATWRREQRHHDVLADSDPDQETVHQWFLVATAVCAVISVFLCLYPCFQRGMKTVMRVRDSSADGGLSGGGLKTYQFRTRGTTHDEVGVPKEKFEKVDTETQMKQILAYAYNHLKDSGLNEETGARNNKKDIHRFHTISLLQANCLVDPVNARTADI